MTTSDIRTSEGTATGFPDTHAPIVAYEYRVWGVRFTGRFEGDFASFEEALWYTLHYKAGSATVIYYNLTKSVDTAASVDGEVNSSVDHPDHRRIGHRP